MWIWFNDCSCSYIYNYLLFFVQCFSLLIHFFGKLSLYISLIHFLLYLIYMYIYNIWLLHKSVKFAVTTLSLIYQRYYVKITRMFIFFMIKAGRTSLKSYVTISLIPVGWKIFPRPPYSPDLAPQIFTYLLIYLYIKYK